MKRKLAVGHKAPNFTAVDVKGEKVSLSSYKGKNVLLVFLRYAGCPWCNLAIHRLSLEYSLLKKSGCEVVAFVQSAKENIISNVYDRHAVPPPFPVIADQGREIYDLYRVNDSLKAVARSITKVPEWVKAVKKHGFKQDKVDGSLFLVPAMFLIGDTNGSQEIIQAEYGQSFYEHETFTSVYRRLIFNEI